MKLFLLFLFGISLIYQNSYTQVGTFDFETAHMDGPNVIQELGEVILTASSSGNLEFYEWEGWGGTSGKALDNTSGAPSLTISFNKIVTISSLRLADAYQDGSDYSYVLTPSPNTGSTVATVPYSGGVTVNFGASFQNINAITITPLGGGNTFLVIDDVVLESILPVELTSFTASYLNNNIALNWQTATEVNNCGFEVERQAGSKQNIAGNWEKIGFVAGYGNSYSPKEYSFVDTSITATTSGVFFNLGGLPANVKYRLKQIDLDGNYKYYSQIAEVNLSPTDVKEKQLPKKFSLSQNYPNPFNPSTSIKYAVSSMQLVTLKVYDILGKEVTTLVNETKAPGNYEVKFSTGSCGNADNLTSGIYYYRITAGNYSETKKMVLLR